MKAENDVVKWLALGEPSFTGAVFERYLVKDD